ncbi:MAG: hypothetical protein QGH47_02000 [Candidatus Woesearchaeota archaeon]|jgi:hypothetical protein|nr:hypothetical protein [Candidatus Woesearchaeota archaeon]
MIKRFIFLLIVMVLLGCSSSEFPPDPGQPGKRTSPLGQATTAEFPAYVPAYSVFEQDGNNNPLPIFTIGDSLGTSLDIETIIVSDTATTIDLNVEVDQPGGFVWGGGFYFNHLDFQWEPYNLDGARAGGTNYIPNFASATITTPLSEFLVDGLDNYILSYSCKKHTGHGTDFKCGCSTVSGPCNQWMIQIFRIERGEEPPPGPDGPRETCTDSDGGQIYDLRGESLGTHQDAIYDGQLMQDNCNGPNGELQEFFCHDTFSIDYGYYACPYGCDQGACLPEPECTGVETTCTGDDLFTCDNEEFVFTETCQHGCSNGACDPLIISCNPTDTRCAGGDLETCNVAGEGYDLTTCQYGCTSGVCDPAPISCNPTDTRCAGSILETCNVAGEGYDLTTCQHGFINGECRICTEGSTSCVDGLTLQECENNVLTESRCSGGICMFNACVSLSFPG